ncbi:hypothetical protein [Pseudoflavonifractor sp. An85]|uniref:hypothetical protein n=1 Tax=Pseudoflavonifractor sp. An85 TaxID=1965661 RepID=UPI000B38563E|nr:hypothetical protein [Pseudoflavonifractor sp. An85]OUN22219.1 hypothetical protein B5G37_10230 [Pseudoflavonifractor sp. An85]
MARKPKKYEDDDGRVIADMSDVSRPNLMHLGGSVSKPTPPPQEVGEQTKEDRPWESNEMSREDRRAYIWAALRAGLLIGLVYLVGFGLLTALLLWLWT